MAISIQYNPSNYFSVHGDIIFTVCDIVKASDPVTYPDYRYICDVYIDGVSVIRLKAYPNPTNKVGLFNVSSIIRSYVSAVFNPDPSALRAQELGDGSFFKDATMKFGEEYNFTLYTNITVDVARKYFNHYNGRLLSFNTTLANFLDKPATSRPLATPVYEDSNFNFIPFFPTATDDITVEIKTYTKYGTFIDSRSLPFAPSVANNIQVFNFSPGSINAAYPGLVNKNIISYYTVTFSSVNMTQDLTYRFNLVCEPRYENYNVHFLNKFGGFESRCFTKVSRKVIDIEKKEYGKLGYTMDSSGIITTKNSNNVYNETRSTFSSQYKEKLSLNTDIMKDDEYTWISELILSPLVYIEMTENGDTFFVPCVITGSNYEFKKVINDKLTSLNINIEFGEQLNAQYR